MSEEKLYRVVDSSATAEHPIRNHEVMVDGQVRQVDFRYGEPTVLPMNVAMKFRKEGFKVSDFDGHEVKLNAVTDETVRIRIGDDEVVAKYDELSIDALQMRAVILPGGEKFLQGPIQKDAVIAFLKAPLAPPVEEVPADPEVLTDAEPADEVDPDAVVEQPEDVESEI